MSGSGDRKSHQSRSKSGISLTVCQCFAGFLFLGIAYGIYMKALGFGVWFPVAMAALIYAGSVEFIAAAALVMPFRL